MGASMSYDEINEIENGINGCSPELAAKLLVVMVAAIITFSYMVFYV